MTTPMPRYEKLSAPDPNYVWEAATYIFPGKSEQVLSLEKISKKLKEHMNLMASTYIWENNADGQSFERDKDLEIRIQRSPKQVPTCCGLLKRSSFHYQALAVQSNLLAKVYVTPEMKRVAKCFFKSIPKEPIPREHAILIFSFQKKQEVPN